MVAHKAMWTLVRHVESVYDGDIERYDIVKCTNCGREQKEQTPFCPICGYQMTVKSLHADGGDTVE